MALNQEALLELMSSSQEFEAWSVLVLAHWQSETLSTRVYWHATPEWARLRPHPDIGSGMVVDLPSTSSADSQTEPVEFTAGSWAWPLGEAGWLICENSEIRPGSILRKTWQTVCTQWVLRGQVELQKSRVAFERWLVSAMSHDLRAPLHSVQGFLDLLENQPDRAIVQLPLVRQETDQLQRLIEQTLDYSRLQAGKLVLMPQTINLLDWLGTFVPRWRNNASYKQLHLNVVVAEDLPNTVILDAERLRQVTLNLLSNAVKYTDSGWVELSVQLSECRNSLILSVQDTGRGIRSEQLTHLFDLYQQTRLEDQFQQGGVGLGLNIVHQLTELMGGRVTVDSDIDVGTTFTVDIPIQFGQPEGSYNGDNLEAINGQDVLLISGRLREMSSLIASLTHLGASVSHAESGPEAVFSIRQRQLKPEWILIDGLLAGIGPEQTLNLCTEALQWSEDQLSERVIWLGQLPASTQSMLAFRLLELPAMLHEVRETFTFSAPRKLATQPTYQHKVLVVDDTELNLTLSEIQLGKLGLSVLKASSGTEALEILDRESVDLIFMDLMMPGMDGFEATRLIREMQRERHEPTTPIVALTANALFNDPAKCRNAGMDDYLAKPYRPEQLQLIVERFLSVTPSNATHSDDAVLSASSLAPKHYTGDSTTALVDWQRALRLVGNDEAVLLTILVSFIEDLPNIRSELASYLSKREWPPLMSTAHTLKGLLKTFGAAPLAETALALEKAAKEESLTRAEKAWQDFEKVYPATLERLQELQGGGEG